MINELRMDEGNGKQRRARDDSGFLQERAQPQRMRGRRVQPCTVWRLWIDKDLNVLSITLCNQVYFI